MTKLPNPQFNIDAAEAEKQMRICETLINMTYHSVMIEYKGFVKYLSLMKNYWITIMMFTVFSFYGEYKFKNDFFHTLMYFSRGFHIGMYLFVLTVLLKSIAKIIKIKIQRRKYYKWWSEYSAIILKSIKENEDFK
jgi:hypothetical protein